MAQCEKQELIEAFKAASDKGGARKSLDTIFKAAVTIASCLMIWFASTFDELRDSVATNSRNTAYLTKAVEDIKKNKFVTHAELRAAIIPLSNQITKDEARLDRRTEFMSNSLIDRQRLHSNDERLEYKIDNHSHN